MELTVADWQWLLGVNLWGVVNGLRSFVPGMLAHGQPGHVVNTVLPGVTTRAHVGPYSATKHAVMAISESLALDLRERRCPHRRQLPHAGQAGLCARRGRRLLVQHRRRFERRRAMSARTDR